MTANSSIAAGSNNVFRDLDFPESPTLLLRGDLVILIRKAIGKIDIYHADVAKRASITQPRMNDLVKNTHKFTLDALADIARGWVMW